MESNDSFLNSEELRKVAVDWGLASAQDVGQLIFKRLAVPDQPLWAARILRLVVDRSKAAANLFDLTVATAETEAHWEHGNQLVERARGVIAMLEGKREYANAKLSDDEELLLEVLGLTECVGQVIYNASLPADPYDAELGEEIAVRLRGFLDERWPTDEFADQAWAALVGKIER